MTTADGLNRDKGSRQVVVPNRLLHGESRRRKASPDPIAESGRGNGAWFDRNEPHCFASDRVVDDRQSPVIDPQSAPAMQAATGTESSVPHDTALRRRE